MPLRQLSKPSKIASAISSRYTTSSTVRVVAAGGELSAGAVGSSTTISVSDIGIVRLAERHAAPSLKRKGGGIWQVRYVSAFDYGAPKPASVIRPLFSV